MKRMIKETLERKFKEENCYFTMQDINVLQRIVRKKERETEGITNIDSRCYEIFITGYEHIKFVIYTGNDDYFGEVVIINEYWIDTKTRVTYGYRNIAWEDTLSRGREYITNRALVQLGYHIANTF